MALGLVCRRSAAGNYNLVAGYHQGDSSYPTGGYTTFVASGSPPPTQSPAVAPLHSVLNSIQHLFFGGIDSQGRLAIYTISAALGLYSAPGTEVANTTDVSNSFMSFMFFVR